MTEYQKTYIELKKQFVATNDCLLYTSVPVLIQADDETLLECLVMNADSEHDADFYEFDLKTVTEYRKTVSYTHLWAGSSLPWD